MNKPRIAVIGAGSFGSNHVRVLRQMPGVEFAGVFDENAEQARKVAREHDCAAIESFENLDAAVVATPTITHEAVASRLLQANVDVLVEKPIADSSAAGERLTKLAAERGRVLQVGHLERFNPAVMALEKAVTVPLFFEVHRMSVFTPRSLDVDVVLDLMIHDLDIVLHLTGVLPDEIRAAGISVLSKKVDIANVRLSFASGCVANLTASRVSTERVRKLRLFQPSEYISVDYARQDASKVVVKGLGQIGFEQLPVKAGEPLQLELESFVAAEGAV
jgi:predicted dehydrogenase